MKDVLAQYLREDAMQAILSRIVPEKSGTQSPVTPVGRIEAYLRSSAVVLFMKGSPDFPQCGFSAQVANALRQCGATFTHVDVLEDPALRQALKTYANWPTIPQLYIEGDLVGGCDIVMDLHRSGELLRMLGRLDAVLAEKRVVAPTPAKRAGARS
jgi:monothiol glutaredoxin